MVDTRRIAEWCGVTAPIVALGAILLATLVASPETFTWRTRPLSDMGRPGTRTFWLFNGGLVLAGLLGIPFVRLVWTESRGWLQRAGTIALAGTLVGMIGVGVFFLEHTTYYLGTELHGPAALITFGLAPLAALLYGAGVTRAGKRWLAVLSIGSAVIQLVVWVSWITLLSTDTIAPGAWFAVPEFVAALCLGGWVFGLAATGRSRSGIDA